MFMKWNNNELTFLKENYNKYTIPELITILNKTKASITNKASKLYLTKTKKEEYTIEFLKYEISKYRSKKELLKKNWKIYNYLKQYNLLYLCDDYVKSYSIPQLVLKHILEILIGECIYNTRSIITPYELDIYFKEHKLAFEYNGHGWHKSDDAKKRDNDKIELCKKENITLITIIENNRNYIDDVKIN